MPKWRNKSSFYYCRPSHLVRESPYILDGINKKLMLKAALAAFPHRLSIFAEKRQRKCLLLHELPEKRGGRRRVEAAVTDHIQAALP